MASSPFLYQWATFVNGNIMTLVFKVNFWKKIIYKKNTSLRKFLHLNQVDLIRLRIERKRKETEKKRKIKTEQFAPTLKILIYFLSSLRFFFLFRQSKDNAILFIENYSCQDICPN